MNCLSLYVLAPSALCLCVGVWADDTVPDDQCACSAGVVLIDADCTVELECRVYRSGPAEQTSSGEPQVDRTDTLMCNNCAEPCNSMHCIQTLCVTKTDRGTVSGTAGFSVSLKAEINNALAGAIGIHTTAEFSAGYTETTEVSTEHCVECGSGSIAPCTGTEYDLKSYKTPKAGKVPLGHRWYTRVTCDGGDPGPWEALKECAGVVGYATVDGQKGTVSGCESESLECGPCPLCDAEPT